MPDRKVFCGHDGGTGCGWYRMILPLAELGKQPGWDVTMASGNLTERQGLRASEMAGHDVIVGQRLNSPRGMHVWREARTPRTRLVYELDDDVFHISPENWAAYQLWRNEEVRDAAAHCIEVSDLVTTTTEPLADVFREFNPNVLVIPNHIPGWVCDYQRARRERPCLGWAGGASHGLDVNEIVNPVKRFLRRFPGWDLRLGGTDYRPTFRAGERASYYPWTHVTDDPEGFYTAPDFDIGLAPLVRSQFTKCKCVDSSMRISTDSGVLEAGSLQPGMHVWREGWRRIEAVRREVPQPGFLLRMEDGYQLRLTPEHRMLAGGEWKPASQIRPGDVIAMEAESAHSGEALRIPWPADSRMSRAYKGRQAADPDVFLIAEDGPKLDITPRWGRFLGAFAGDGSVGQAMMIQVSCDGIDQDWIDLLMDDLRAFGLNPRTEEIKTFDKTVLRRRAVRASSAHLLRVLASLGVTAPRPNGKPIRVPCVPEIIWRSPKPVIAEFLAGYFEADGYCTGSGVAVVSKDERLIRDVQRLLLLFGITSVVRSRVHSAQNGHSGLYWRCELRRMEADIFAKEIGFRSQRKTVRLREIVSRRYSNGVKPMKWSRQVALIERCFVTPVDIQVEGSVFILAGFVSHNSAVKALEWGALGIPVIATDWAPYSGYVRHGETGFLVKHDHEWLHYMSLLASDDRLREEMGNKAREVARQYAIEQGWRLWADAYENLFSR